MTAQQSTQAAAQRRTWQITLETNWFHLLVLALLILFPTLVGWFTGSDPLARRGLAVFWQSLMIEFLIFAMLAMSYNLIFGFTGVISFGHAMFFGLGSYIMGGFQRAGGDAGLLIGILLALIITGLLGLLIGFVSLRLRGVYFAMFTLAVAQMVFTFFERYGPTGSEDGFTLSTLPEWFDPSRNRIVYYYIVVAFFAGMFLLIRRLMNSPTGAVLLGIRENEDRARTIGYDTLRFKLLAITLAGVLAAVAGMLFTILNKKVGPELLGLDFTVNPLLHTIIGGIGTFTGPVVGAVGLRLIEHEIRGLTVSVGSLTLNIGQSWPVILGLIFILVVIIFPQGIAGTWNRWRARRAGATRRERSAEATPAGD